MSVAVNECVIRGEYHYFFPTENASGREGVSHPLRMSVQNSKDQLIKQIRQKKLNEANEVTKECSKRLKEIEASGDREIIAISTLYDKVIGVLSQDSWKRHQGIASSLLFEFICSDPQLRAISLQLDVSLSAFARNVVSFLPHGFKFMILKELTLKPDHLSTLRSLGIPFPTVINDDDVERLCGDLYAKLSSYVVLKRSPSIPLPPFSSLLSTISSMSVSSPPVLPSPQVLQKGGMGQGVADLQKRIDAAIATVSVDTRLSVLRKCLDDVMNAVLADLLPLGFLEWLKTIVLKEDIKIALLQAGVRIPHSIKRETVFPFWEEIEKKFQSRETGSESLKKTIHPLLQRFKEEHAHVREGGCGTGSKAVPSSAGRKS